MALAELVASWSKDRSAKVGSVIVNDRNTLLAIGWNGFARGIRDDIDCRHERPAKYMWTEHAERNALYNAAAEGISIRGARIYVTRFPCSDCARAIVQAGIVMLIVPEPDWNDHRWSEEYKVANEMLAEAGIEVRFYG